MPWIELPPPLQKLTDGTKKVQVEGRDLKSAMTHLLQVHPKLENKVLNQRGDIYQYVKVYVDGEDCRFLDGLQTPLKTDSKITILVAMAGG